MKKVLRIIGILLGILVVFVLVMSTIFYLQGSELLNRTWDIDIADLEIPTDEETLKEGARIWLTRECAGCHGDDAGGQILFDSPGFAVVYATNLTGGIGGIGQNYETTDYVRAIQHGVDKTGQALVFMEAIQYEQMQVNEIIPLIAYLQTLEAVDKQHPDVQIDLLGRIFLGTGIFPLSATTIDHDIPRPLEPISGASIIRGESLANQMCTSCHQSNLAGGTIVFAPDYVAPNITFHPDGLAGWSLDDFISTMRTATNPDGQQLGEPMAWDTFAQLTDEELESLYLYLQFVKPLPQK